MRCRNCSRVIPSERQKSSVSSCVTSRGMNEEDMDQIAEAIALMVKDKENIEKAKAIVKQLTDKYPLNA